MKPRKARHGVAAGQVRVTVDYGGTWIRIGILTPRGQKVAPRGQNVRRFRIPSQPLGRLPQILKRFFTARKLTPGSLSVGARGVWTQKERRDLHRKLKGLASKVSVCSDVEMAHARAFGSKPGIILIAGTGSICYGKDRGGSFARAGGLGPQKGDEGSGYWLGKMYLLKTKGGLGKRTVKEIASYAPEVIRKAKGKDPLAMEILLEGQNHLARLVKQVAKKLKFGRGFPLVLAGGLFEDGYFRKMWGHNTDY